MCDRCAHDLEPPPTTSVRDVGPVPAAFAYAGTGAELVQALKFRDGRRLVAPLADRLCDVLDGAGISPSIVSWVPTSARRRRTRGFDQAELVARAVARRLGAPCRPTLRREPGPAQTGRDRAHRERNVRFAPVAPRALASRHVMLIDDVCTTGATARAAVEALHPARPGRLTVAVVARTP